MSAFTVVTKKTSKEKFLDNINNYEVQYNNEKNDTTNELKIIDRFIGILIRKIPDCIINANVQGNKYCYIFKYNDDPDNGEIVNDTIEGLDTKYILSGKWIPKAKKYFPFNRCRSIQQRISHFLKTELNNGIDPDTKQPWNVSVFYYKKENSIFNNGIIISRDGIIYK